MEVDNQRHHAFTIVKKRELMIKSELRLRRREALLTAMHAEEARGFE